MYLMDIDLMSRRNAMTENLYYLLPESLDFDSQNEAVGNAVWCTASCGSCLESYRYGNYA